MRYEYRVFLPLMNYDLILEFGIIIEVLIKLLMLYSPAGYILIRSMITATAISSFLNGL